MVRPPKPIEISCASFNVVADDGNLDLAELDALISYALADHVIDAQEKRLLGELLGQIRQEKVSPAVWQRIQTIRKKHGIGEPG